MEVLHLPLPPKRMEILELSRSRKCPRPKSSRLRQKIDNTFSYFTQKVDPIISACVATFLFKQPMNILAAMMHYFEAVRKKIVGDCFKEAKCYYPKKSQKIYFVYDLAPKLSKIVDSIAASQPSDVLDFICQLLKDLRSSNYKDNNRNEFEQKICTSATRDKIGHAISLAGEINHNSSQEHTIKVQREESFENASISSIPKSIQISVLGMDGGGKTSIINALQGKFQTKMKPSLGFKPTTMSFGEKFNVKFYDLGGAKKIRNIWSEYYHDVHGILYVFDGSLKGNELEESIKLFQSTIQNKFLKGKPLLILSNKQDKKNCKSGIALYNLLNLKELGNCSVVIADCSSFISKCNKNCFNLLPSEMKSVSNSNLQLSHIFSEDTEDETLDPRMESALEDFLTIIENDFTDLDCRVKLDLENKKAEEIKKRYDRERKVLKNKIASVFRNVIESSLLPENLPEPGEDDSFTKEEGMAFIASEIGSEIHELEEVRNNSQYCI